MKLLKTLWNLPETLSSDDATELLSVIAIVVLSTYLTLAVI